jgi:hypothetical protein
MARLKLLSATLIAAVLLAAPVIARESHATPRRPAEDANACASAGARYIDRHPCYHPDGMRGDGERDVWGHWGSYYGPLVHVSLTDGSLNPSRR